MPSEPLIDIVSQTELVSDSAYLQSLQTSLSDWVDMAKAYYYASSPSQLFEAVFEHYHQIIPSEFENTLNVDLLVDERLLDEAAYLHHQLQRGAASDGSRPAAPESSSQLRARFLLALRSDWDKWRMLDELFVPPVLAEQNPPFFNGFSFRNAVGKSFDDLVGLVDWARWPAVQVLSVEQKRDLIKQKFDSISESTQYRIGTPQQSMASAVIRILKYQGKIVPESFTSEETLLEQFKNIDTVWLAGEKNYLIQPRLLFALHLARSSDVEIMTARKLLVTYHNEVLSRVNTHVRAGDILPLRWVASYLAQWNNDGIPWNYQDEAVSTEALLSLFIELHDLAIASDPISGFAGELKQAGLLRERLVGNNWQEKAQALLVYANQRLLAVSGTPPRFDRWQAAKAILLQNGRSEAYLSQSREYVLVGDGMNFSQTKFGNPVDEFLARADWRGILGQTVNLPGGRRLHARTELQVAEETFNNNLASDVWVVAKARENLRMRLKPLSDDRVACEAQSVAENYKAETETHRAWISGFELWVNQVPVLGPIYNIEEGIRHQDAVQALLGVLFLGLDAFDLVGGESGGAKSGRRSISSHERISPRESLHGANFRRAGQEAGIPLERIGSHPSEIEVDTDLFNISQKDANVPASYRTLATQVRNGQADVKWQGYDVVHVQNENRIVPVDLVGGSYVEIDWHTAHRVPNAQLIQRDPVTRVFRSGMGLKGGGGGLGVSGGGRSKDLRVRGVKAEERYTVAKVAPLLQQASDVSLRNFDTFFDDCFTVAPVPGATSRFDAKRFYGKLYRNSTTFRRLANRYDSSTTQSRRWQIVVGDTSELRQDLVGYTNFANNRVYLADDAIIQGMQYMTADGFKTGTLEQVYLHEMVHVLTGARDPERMLDLLNRGPVVYLTDKILSEAGYSVPEQVMYRRQNVGTDASSHDTVEYRRGEAAFAANIENRYLDPIVDTLHPSITRDSLVEGVEVEHRVTVLGVKKIRNEISRAGTGGSTYREGYIGKFRKNFAISTAESAVPGTISQDLERLVHFYGRLYKKSATFRRLFDAMTDIGASAESTAIWKFELDRNVAIHELPTGRVAHGINDIHKKIYIFEDRTLYLSAEGIKPVQFERKLTHEMVCVVTGTGRVKLDDAYQNRGPALYFTDTILKEAGFSQPQQIAAALAQALDPDSITRLLSYQTSARRSADIEDRYLSQAA